MTPDLVKVADLLEEAADALDAAGRRLAEIIDEIEGTPKPEPLEERGL